MPESTKDNEDTKKRIQAILDGLDIKKFPNIGSLSYEERLPLIDKIQGLMVKYDHTGIKVITMYEDALAKYGNHFNTAYMAKMNRMVLNYKISYMKNNVDKRKFPHVTSLKPEIAVELTDNMSKEQPGVNITKQLIILEKKLKKEYAERNSLFARKGL